MTNQKNCALCNNRMNLVVRSGGDGKTWQCGRPCRAPISVRDNTFFSKSRLPTIIEFIYSWSYEDLSFKKAKREFGMSQHTSVDWKMFLRDVCAEYLINHPVRIGGVGRTVEIDESVFTRRKYNRGRMEVLTPRRKKDLWYQWIGGTLTLCSRSSKMISFLGRRLSPIFGELTTH